MDILIQLPRRAWRRLLKYYRQNIWHKIWCIFVAIVTFGLLSTYGIAQWYIQKHADEPLVIGATFIPNYARYLGVDPKETLTAIFDDLGIKRIRLVSYWDIGEPERGQYDFSELDWQFELAESRGVTVSLAVGLRQPRWPECHMPTWAKTLPMDEWAPLLKQYMQVTVERYKDSPVLESYQLENEFLLKVFGECPDHSPERLIDEFYFLRALDSSRPIIVNRSNNAVPSWPINEPRADLVGASIYKRVWDSVITRRYLEYPIPPWFYAFLAAGTEITTGRNTFIHELQTEAWIPEGFGGIANAPISEQNKSFQPEDIGKRLDYAVKTGMRTIDLWGVEWWYSRMKVQGDPSLWEAGQSAIAETNQENNTSR